MVRRWPLPLTVAEVVGWSRVKQELTAAREFVARCSALAFFLRRNVLCWIGVLYSVRCSERDNTGDNNSRAF